MKSCQLTCHVLLHHLLLDPSYQATLMTALVGPPSVVSPTSKGKPNSFIHLDTSSKRSFPVVVPYIDCNHKNSSVMHRRMKIKKYCCSHPQQGSMWWNLFTFPQAVVELRWQADARGQQECFGSSSHLKMFDFFPHAVFDKFSLGKGPVCRMNTGPC